MEKDIGKISKKEDTDIVVRIDDFGGRTGLTIREFVTNDRYTGFTKNGTRIPADKFSEFKELINSIDEKDLQESEEGKEQEKLGQGQENKQEDKQETGEETESKESEEETYL